VLLAQLEAACVGPGRWLHEARYLVYARDKGELRLALPPGARWLAAAVDGQPVLPASSAPDELSLPLPEGHAPWVVQVRWDYPQGVETAAGPERAAPRLLGCEVLAHETRFYVPAGYRRLGAALAPPGPQALELFELAQAYQRLSMLLSPVPGKADALKPGLLAAQQHFFGALRHLEQALSWHGGAASEALQKKAQKLRQDNLIAAKAAGFDALRKRAETEPWTAAAGRLAFAPLSGGEICGADETATVRLRSVADELASERRQCTELLLLVGVSLLLVSYLRHGLLLLHALWPEQLALLAGIGLLAWGVSIVGIGLLLAAGLARLFFVVCRLRAWLTRRAAESDADEAVDPVSS
jgi:hypothetical protein